MRSLILLCGFGATLAIAAPECVIDARTESDRLVNVVSGTATGFLPNEAVFVTVTNGSRSFTTQAARDGKWAMVYVDEALETSVLCWQGFKPKLEARGVWSH